MGTGQAIVWFDVEKSCQQSAISKRNNRQISQFCFLFKLKAEG
jgi:hypothetical protein